MQPLTCMVKTAEILLLVYEKATYTRSPNTAKIGGNGPESLDYIVKLIQAYLIQFPLGGGKFSHMHYITLFKAAFVCKYCKFYSLFGNLFQLNMKSCLQ